ncbi:hypothetical protein ACLBX9_28670 [Methylobacterium sp. A49B]
MCTTFDTPIRKTSGRRSIVGTHPQREKIGSVFAACISLRESAIRFGLIRTLPYRYWHSLSAEHLRRLAIDASNLDNTR